MSKLILVFLLTLLSNTLYGQELRYVSDTLYVLLRSGPSSDTESVSASLVSGTELTLLNDLGSTTNEYQLVRTGNGIEGWIHSRYLIDSPTSKILLEELTERYEAVLTETTRLKDLVEAEGLDVNADEQQRPAYTEDLLMTTDTNTDELLLNNQSLQDKLQNTENERQRLQDIIDANNFWNGVIAVFLGISVAIIIPRLKPSKHSEWK